MVKRRYPSSPLLAACTAIWRDDKILLAYRDRSPNQGTWAMPGGLVEIGESLEQAAIRETLEETALLVKNLKFLQFSEIIRHDEVGRVEFHYVLAIFVARSNEGEAVAGDDAARVDWFRQEDFETLPLTANTELFVEQSRILLQS